MRVSGQTAETVLYGYRHLAFVSAYLKSGSPTDFFTDLQDVANHAEMEAMVQGRPCQAQDYLTVPSSSYPFTNRYQQVNPRAEFGQLSRDTKAFVAAVPDMMAAFREAASS